MLTVTWAISSQAQAYPSKPIQLVVPSAAGGPTDGMARIVAEQLQKRLGQPVNVDNRPGASGLIAFEYVAKSKPDGYTILLGDLAAVYGWASTGHSTPNLQTDFVPVSLLAEAPVALVVDASLPAKSVKELLDFAAAAPGEVTFAVSGTGSPSALAGEQFKRATQTRMTRVPYRTGPAALAAFASENAKIAFVPLGDVVNFGQQGKVRTLAVTGQTRSTQVPDAPTFDEIGIKNVDAASQYALLLPRGTPPAIIATLHKEVKEITSSSEFQGRISHFGAKAVGSTPDALARVIRAGSGASKWTSIMKDGGEGGGAVSAPVSSPAMDPIDIESLPPPSAGPPLPTSVPLGDVPYKVVKVLFGTDRKLNPAAGRPSEFFDGSRGHAITYGTCEVSIPRTHKIGELEAPSVLRRFFETPEKHVVLLRVDLRSKDEFMSDLHNAATAAKSRSALVFIHGYNNSFEDAARRTAQIAHDIEFQGVPLFYSWPSNGATLSYFTDGNDADQAVAYLKTFLRELVESSRFSSITLLAHSMGSRVLTQAFTSLRTELKANDLKIFKEVILAAPDIDADYFKNTIAPALLANKTPVTLYASSSDQALQTAKEFNGAARAGDSGSGLVVLKGIETIDATAVDTNLFWGLGHAYVADSRNVLADLSYLIGRGLRASARFGLEPVQVPGGAQYWKFKE